MPLDATGYKAKIVLEVGDDGASTVARNIELLWVANDDKAADPYVQYLYTKRDALLVLMGSARQMVSFRALDGASVNLSDLMKNLESLLAGVESLISQEAEALRAAAIAPLTTTAPIAPPPNWPDANDPKYKGSVYSPLPRVIGRTPS